MAKANVIGLSGAVTSVACAGAFWMVALLMSGISSNMTQLEFDVRELMMSLAALYTLGALLGLVSQLGAFLQLPSLVVALPIIWYVGGPLVFYLFYLAGLLGASLLVLAMFFEYSGTDRAFKAPPFSRFTIWNTAHAGPRGKPFTKGMVRAVLATFVACAITAAAFAAYSWSNGVSDLRIEFYTDGAHFGSMNVSISMDGEEVYGVYLEYDPEESWLLSAATSCTVSAGTHLLEVDVWNDSDIEQGNVDIRKDVRVLPFTSDSVQLMLYVGMV